MKTSRKFIALLVFGAAFAAFVSSAHAGRRGTPIGDAGTGDKLVVSPL